MRNVLFQNSQFVFMPGKVQAAAWIEVDFSLFAELNPMLSLLMASSYSSPAGWPTGQTIPKLRMEAPRHLASRSNKTVFSPSAVPPWRALTKDSSTDHGDIKVLHVSFSDAQ